RAPFRTNGWHEQHVRAGTIKFKELGCAFLQTCRCEWPKCFSVFYACIENIFVLSAHGTHENTSIAEGSRPHFRAGMQSPDNVIFGQQVGGFFQDAVSFYSTACGGQSESRFDLVTLMQGTDVRRNRCRKAGLFVDGMIAVEHSTERNSCIG